MRLALALVFLLAGCMPARKAKAPVEDDNSKAFAELEKNDRDSPVSGVSSKTTGEAERPKGAVFPAPFTAEQIRDATKNGRTYKYKVEVPSKPATQYAITFRNVDSGGAEVSQAGQPARRLGWSALQADAEFPKDRTSTHDEKLKTPAGKFECVVYEVKRDDDELWTYFFAKKLPGAPVFFYVERNGKRLRTTTLIEHVAGR